MKHAALLLALLALTFTAGCQTVGRPSAAEKNLAALDFRQVVQSAKDKVFPAVVYIKVIRETHEAGKKISQEISGSGVIVSPDGEVLTNWHVVDKAVQVRCLLYDGRAMDAEVVGTDKDTDLAVVRLARPDLSPVPFAELGDSDVLKEGDFVMAMGAPWGLSRSVSIGIVSCTRRFLPESSEYSLWLQTDASISPGNSGGPLVNTDGKVIGINTLGALMGGDLGFSVPSNTVRHILAQIREFGKVNWSWTGLQLQPLHDFDRNIYFEGADGVIVSETDPESPARRAGLLPRDRILEVGGQVVSAVTAESLPPVRRIFGILEKGRPVELKVLRGDKMLTVELTPREKGKVEGEELDCPRWDLTVKQINQFDNPELYFHRKEGVFIYGVKSPGNAGNAGLRPKDIILSVDGQEVKTLGDVKKIHAQVLENVRKQHRIMFSVLRNGLLRQIVLDFSRDYEKE
jgi:serine protease Do